MTTDEIVDILKAEFEGKDYVISWDVVWDIKILLSEDDDFDKASKSISESAIAIITQLEDLPGLSLTITQTESTPTQINSKSTFIYFSDDV
ncbi:hypothetical protein [Mucilaginibacter paludis]|uniref:Uncharacterized protein n=1 Tax=Mucilaginibacter paludis DSM 18603 TaxID=714943 RepID=H1YCB3_9SPHI|nr:hypothetical protein [Mucilaginibacter paludis]EHQ30104.1 hypothetical protein Mucpa_6046 [Mucilaginibacter paludis DSM 18603]